MATAPKPVTWWKIRDTPFSGKRIGPLLALGMLSLPNPTLTVALGVVWIVVGHWGLNMVYKYHVQMHGLRMAIDSAAAVLLNLWVLLQWSEDVSFLVTLVPLFFLVHIFLHSDLHQSSYTMYLTAVVGVLLLVHFFWFMYSQGDAVNLAWHPRWAQDESLSAAGSYILFLELVGFAVFQADVQFGKKRSVGRVDELVRTSVDITWVLIFVYSDVARPFFRASQLTGGVATYLGIVGLEIMTVLQLIEMNACLKEDNVRPEVATCATLLLMCVAAVVTPYQLLWVVFALALMVMQVGSFIDMFYGYDLEADHPLKKGQGAEAEAAPLLNPPPPILLAPPVGSRIITRAPLSFSSRQPGSVTLMRHPA